MPWVRLEDDFTEHPKILRAGPLAGWLWLTAIAWSNRNGTDGHIPLPQIRRLADFDGIGVYLGNFSGDDVDPMKLADVLVDAGLFEAVHGGFYIHDYDHYQLTVAAMRERSMAKQAAGRAGGQASARARGQAGASAGAQAKSKPNTQHPTTTSSSPARPDVDELCALLASLMQENGARKPSIGQAWHDAGRLLLDRDGVSLGEAKQVLEWCQHDSFWKSNILSMPKFREKFDQLRLKANAVTNGDGYSVPDGVGA